MLILQINEIISFSLQGKNLWWPDSLDEVDFIDLLLPGKAIHLGYRYFSEWGPVVHSDNSEGVGIAAFTHSETSGMPLPVGIDYTKTLIGSGQCLMQSGSKVELHSTCPSSPATVCQRKIGEIK